MSAYIADRDALPSGRDLIAAERRRQIEAEGWTPEHDAQHAGTGCLLRAAEAYEWDDASRWPWGGEWWKPKDALSNLVRAGALYQASADLGGYTAAADAGVVRCAEKIDALLTSARNALIASGAVIDAATLADELRAMGAIWGGDSMWVTTGTKVADLMAETLAAALTERGEG